MKTDTDKYYKFLRHVNRTICLYCQKTLSGTTTSNIRRHYKIVHSIEIPRKKETQNKTKEECTETSVKERKNQEGIFIDIDKSKFLRCCVGLVTAKNMPLDIYDDEEFFKILISPYEKKFDTNLNSKNIVSLIENSSTKIQQIITERIRNKIICLDFNIVKIMDYRILVIDVHFIQDFQICIYTIGVIILKPKQEQHTTYLKENIIKCLKTYHINMGQIYFSTSNNCENMPQINAILHTVKEEENCSEFMEEKCVSAENTGESIHSIVSRVLPVGKNVAHTIKLMVYDVFKNLEAQINQCRDFIIRLRKNFEENDAEVKIPNLDNSEHWQTTYEMLFSLIQLRQQIETWYIQRDIVMDINWDFITDFVVAFNPLVACTKKMQSEQYIIGDFYRDWLCCEIELEDLYSITRYASMLHESMQKTKKIFLDDDAFLAALYVDARFNFENSMVLSEEQKSTAIAKLLKIFENLKKFEDTQPVNDEMDVECSKTSSYVSFDFASTSSDSTYSKLEQRMRQSMMSNSNANTHLTFQQKITLLANQKKVPLDTDIFNFWLTARHDNDTKKTTSIVLALPITQVSKDKAFKALSTILTKFESTIDNDTLNSLLITKLNFVEHYINNIHLDFADHNILVLNEADKD